MSADRINELYAGDIFDLETQRTARKRIHWICAQAQGDKILDVGCSQGVVCLLLGREGFECVGVDQEQNAIDYANRELEKEENPVRKRVQFQLAEASRLPFDDSAFDSVILGEILEHLTHPQKVLKEAQRVLKQGGVVIITTPFGLHLDPDHKRTYYPRSFLEDVQPFFKTMSMDILDNYIIYTGSKDPSYRFSEVSKEILALEKLALQERFEEKYLRNELTLLEKSKQLQDRAKIIQQEVKIQVDAKDQELKRLIAVKDKNINELNKALTEKDTEVKNLREDLTAERKQLQHITQTLRQRDRKIGELEETLEPLEDELRCRLTERFRHELALRDYRLRKEFKQSWTWRIGTVFVIPFTLITDFVRHPISAAKGFRSRIKELSNHFYHCGSPPKKTGKAVEPISTNLADRPARDMGRQDVVGNHRLSFGCILDEFTRACFGPECRLITFRPDNWKEVLEQRLPQGIFVESAWRGNDGSWQYRVAKYARNMGDELQHLLSWAKAKSIPTLFWNKEDPPHYDRFVDNAKLFDYVFTSDADCIPRYQKELGHERIFPLPFAAQPRIHNPILDSPRKHSVCFAGTYYGGSHEERRRDMELILKPAIDFGLHIYDRQFGMTGPDAAQFRFPDIYQPAIKGRLDYADMVKAYKQYQVFLNVNSIKTSPTMFSRRVFELLACGTPVISTYSKGIVDLLGDDIVLITESEADTKRHLERLLNDADYSSRLSVKGVRKVLEDHTYNQRLKYIANSIGFDFSASNHVSFTVISKIRTPEELSKLQDALQRQICRNFDVALFLDNGLENNHLDTLRSALPGNTIRSFPSDSEKACEDCLHSASGDYLVVFNSGHYYGTNYLRDYSLPSAYAECDFIGKHSHFVAVGDKAQVNDPGHEFQFVSRVPSSTLAVKKHVLNPMLFSDLFEKDVFELENATILSLDRYNYMKLHHVEDPSSAIIDSMDL